VDEVRGKDGRIYIDNHATIWRWRDAFQNDFAARMDWCVNEYEGANHPPLVRVSGSKEVRVKRGEKIILDATGSSDPDGDALQYKWIHYPEPGDYWHWNKLSLQHSDSARLTLAVPPNVRLSKPHTTHLILQVTDAGKPPLTGYHRIVLVILPKE
jgi:hypothetical protein